MFKKVKSLFDSKEPQATVGGSNESDTSSHSSSPSARSGGAPPPKIWAIPPSVREQLAKGGAVRYNIKVVLRGARRVGKSSIMNRLQGTFQPGGGVYVPSDEISAATIYHQLEGAAATGRSGGGPGQQEGLEAAKVDLWDVVDEGKKIMGPIKGGGGQRMPPRQAADATTVDVYKNCHAAIFIVDVTRWETWEYVLEEVKKVPPTCAICIALNFCDAPKPHPVTEKDVVLLSNSLPRCCTSTVLAACQGQPPPRDISFGPTWASLSAQTGQGVDLLRSFLAVPVALERLQTLELRMKTIYSDIEGHQALLLQQRAMNDFEFKEKQKSQTRENSISGSNPAIAATINQQQAAAIGVSEKVEETKQQPEPRRDPSPKPAKPESPQDTAAPIVVSPGPLKDPKEQPPAAQPTNNTTPIETKNSAISTPEATTVVPPPPTPTAVTTVVAPPAVAATKQQQSPKKVVPADQRAPSQRTVEEEKRIQEDFYGGDDDTEEEEEAADETDEESDDEPILTPAARRAQLLQKQREQNATNNPPQVVTVAAEVVSSLKTTTDEEPPPTNGADKVVEITTPVVAVSSSYQEASASNDQQEEVLPMVEEEVPTTAHKPTWQEDADKLATIAVDDGEGSAGGAGGKGLDAFLGGGSDDEEEDMADNADESVAMQPVAADEEEEEVAAAEKSEVEEVDAPARPVRGSHRNKDVRQRGPAPVTTATPSSEAGGGVAISDEVSEMLKQMAAAMTESIGENEKKAKKSKKAKPSSSEAAAQGGDEKEDKKSKRHHKEKSSSRKGGDEGVDGGEEGTKKEKNKKEKKHKKKADEEEAGKSQEGDE